MKVTINEKQTVDSYPYGRLRTTAYFSIEFQPKKGFRSVFQTINPKTGRINKEKKGVYHDIMYMTIEDGFVKFHAKEFYKIENFNKVTQWLSDNFDMYTADQMKYIYSKTVSFLAMEVYALKAYCNVDKSKSVPLIQEAHSYAMEGIRNSWKNLFSQIKIDHEKIEALKDPEYNPFKVTSYGVDTK